MTSPEHGSPTAQRDALALLAAAPSLAHDPCIADDVLVAWHENELDAAQARSVKRHVAGCERCFDTWAALNDAMPRPASAPTWVDRWRDAWRARPRWQPMAAGAIVVLLGVALGDRLLRSGGPDLINYELSVQGSTMWRGDEPSPGDVMALAPGDRFELLLRPATATGDAPVVRLYRLTDSSPAAVRAPTAQRLDQGTLRLRGTIGDDVALPLGPSRLLILLGPTATDPDVQDALQELGAEPSVRTSRWQAWRIDVTVTPR